MLDGRRNTRHSMNDRYNIGRLALSLWGFDNSTISFYDPHRFQISGVKQTWEKAFGIGQSSGLSIFSAIDGIRVENDDAMVTAVYPGRL